jgi:hypothetical protein
MHVCSATVGSILISLILDEFEKVTLSKIPDGRYTVNTRHHRTMVLQFG